MCLSVVSRAVLVHLVLISSVLHTEQCLARISIVMSVCLRLPVRMEQLDSHWPDFREI